MCVCMCACVCLKIPMLKPDNAMKIQDLLRKRKENSEEKNHEVVFKRKKLDETFHLELSAASKNLFIFKKQKQKTTKHRTDLRTTTATVNTADSRLMRDEDDKY